MLYTLLHIQSLTVNFHNYKFYSEKGARTHGGGTHANLGSFLSRASRLQDFTRPLFPRGLFTVSLNGLSEKATTRSQVSRQLNLRSKQTNEQVARFPERCATVHTCWASNFLIELLFIFLNVVVFFKEKIAIFCSYVTFWLLNSCQWPGSSSRTVRRILFTAHRGTEDTMFLFECHFLLVSGNFIDVYAAGGGLEGPSSVR